MDILVIYMILATLVLFNVWASARLIKSEHAERAQKVYQLIFIWLIPAAGAVICIYLHKPDASTKPLKGPNDTAIQNNDGIDLALSKDSHIND
ncbi:hypothetical protein [Pleionea sediminis]|uniref:hypothetical protein n=1 Tax=Pleionea sediminis TaxID=2569479 RepID=UPI0011854153|nr:hypothetical protein [Pleionea sediminis]